MAWNHPASPAGAIGTSFVPAAPEPAETLENDGRAERQPLLGRLVGVEPFRRLVVAHAAGVAGDAFFAVSLADSLFFAVSADAARPSILLYLLLTLAPFAIVGPFVGSLIDRFPGRQRALIAGTNLGRAVAMVLVGWQRTSLLFFPLAFAVLVFGKAASVTKSALVPCLVRDHSRLVAENARLTRMVAVTSVSAGGLAAGALMVANAEVVLFAGAIIHLLAIPLAWRIPSVPVGSSEATSDNVELRGGPLTIAANAMSAVSAATGFVVFLLAFELKVTGRPAWFFGLVIAAGGVGGFLGTFVATAARRWRREEALIAMSLGLESVVALLTAINYRPVNAVVVTFTVGLAASIARRAFDSLTQRLTPDAEQGRAFAKFETRFQIAWVFGAVVPVLLQPSAAVGLQLLGIALGVALLAYLGGGHASRLHHRIAPAVSDATGEDLALQLFAIAERLREEGADRLAVVTAVEAVRVGSSPRRPSASDHPLLAELNRSWNLAVSGTGRLPGDVVENSFVLARMCLAQRSPVEGAGL